MIRLAEPSEIDWINQRYDEVEFVHSHFDKEVIAIAEVGGQKAGIGRLVSIDKNNWELGGMYVFDNFRGQGIAGEIVEFLLKHAKKGERVFCIPFEHLISFYQRYGFEPCKNLNDAPAEVVNKYRWCKEKYPQNTALLVLTSEK